MSEAKLVLKTRPGPQDANLRGDTFGGWLLSQIDIAGSIVACETAQGMTATRAIKELSFLQPIFVYDLVSFYAKLIGTGKTSITVQVEVFAQRMNGLTKPVPEASIKVSDATLVYVAISEPGKTRELKK